MIDLSKPLTPEERTQLLMELGHLLVLHNNFWLGTMLPQPEDLGIKRMNKFPATLVLDVMPKSWIKSAKCLRHTIYENHVQTYTYSLDFEGLTYRYVFDCALPYAINNLDNGVLRVKKFYDKQREDYRLLQSNARQLLAKKAKELWKSVGHMVNEFKSLTGEMPDAWRAAMQERLMAKRFPTKANMDAKGYTYSIFVPTQRPMPVVGKYMKASPGIVESTARMSMELQNFPEEACAMINRRIHEITALPLGNKFSVLCQRHIKNDIAYLASSNPIPVEGYGFQEKLDKIIELAEMDKFLFRDRRAERDRVALAFMDLMKVIQGPWAEVRKTMYLNAFGPPLVKK